MKGLKRAQQMWDRVATQRAMFPEGQAAVLSGKPVADWTKVDAASG